MDTLIDDIGSFPLPAEINRVNYAKAYELAREALINHQDSAKDEFIQKNFYNVVLDSFRKKLSCGLDVVNFPQHYSGIKQVGDAIHAAMEKGSFVVDQEKAFLPEIHVLNHEAKNLSEEFGKKIMLRVSIFGPIEQYLNEVGATAYPDVLDGFAQTINRFAKNSIINNKYIETKVVSIDEPSLGHTNLTATPELIRETLQKAYDFSGPTKQIHLHFTTGIHDLLNVQGLDVLSFEYAASPKNIESVPKSMLQKADKQIRVGIARTDIDAIWAELYEKGITKPSTEQLVEGEETMKKRYVFAKEKYGETMTFTGPDCGLGSWPSQEAAELLLRRTVKAVKGLNFFKIN
jgi:5-methyltetrahydropteroyltriglutamate--homocysteine methyltransferase